MMTGGPTGRWNANTAQQGEMGHIPFLVALTTTSLTITLQNGTRYASTDLASGEGRAALRRRAARRRRARRRAGLALATVAALAALAGLSMGLTHGNSSGSGPGSSAPRSGGTLTVTFEGPPASLDPAVAWDAESWSIERLTYQTLVTFAGKPGEAGTKLVSALASPVPSVANGGIRDGGRVYTFHLRSGVTFAPPVGTAVTAAGEQDLQSALPDVQIGR